MKVERISSNQIRFIFMAQDLAERNINISDLLARSSNKTQVLFQEITAMLNDEYDFAAAGTPLMFEATMMRDTLSVLVTKMPTDEGAANEAGSGIGVMSDVIAQLSKNMKNKGSMVSGNYTNIDISGYEPHLQNAQERDDLRQAPASRVEYSAFVFKSIDDLAAAAARIDDDMYLGCNHVFKLNGEYHLLLRNFGPGTHRLRNVVKLLHEFGQRQVTSPLSYSIMQEYGEVVIADDALAKLKLCHGSK